MQYTHTHTDTQAHSWQSARRATGEGQGVMASGEGHNYRKSLGFIKKTKAGNRGHPQTSAEQWLPARGKSIGDY